MYVEIDTRGHFGLNFPFVSRRRVMMTLSMDRILQLEETWRREVNEFLRLRERYELPSPLFLEERNIREVNVAAMSAGWGCAQEELVAFVKLQYYLTMAAGYDEDMEDTSIAAIATELGIASQMEEFEDYFHKRILQIHQDLEECDDFGQPAMRPNTVQVHSQMAAV